MTSRYSRIQANYLSELKKISRSRWKTCTRFARTSRIDKTLPSNGFQKLFRSLPRKNTLFQLLTGHAPVKSHLFRIGISDTATCPTCNASRESVYHYLMSCMAYAPHRRIRDITLSRGSILLSSPKALQGLFKYIHTTCLFKNSFGNALLIHSSPKP